MALVIAAAHEVVHEIWQLRDVNSKLRRLKLDAVQQLDVIMRYT